MGKNNDRLLEKKDVEKENKESPKMKAIAINIQSSPPSLPSTELSHPSTPFSTHILTPRPDGMVIFFRKNIDQFKPSPHTHKHIRPWEATLEPTGPL